MSNTSLILVPDCPPLNQTEFDCKFYANCTCLFLKSDPDIAGLGVSLSLSRCSNHKQVIVSFMATAGLTVLTTCLALIFNLLSYSHNSIDRGVRRCLSALGATELSRASVKFWNHVIECFLLGHSDQQLVLGTALLLVACIQLPIGRGQIRVYHFSIIYDLAWFASGTHLDTCFVLSDHLRRHRALRVWRTIWMVIMAGLLVWAVFISAHQDWYSAFNCPAECMTKDLFSNIRGDQLKWLIVTLVMLVWAYMSTLFPLFTPTRRGGRIVKRLVRRLCMYIPAIQVLGRLETLVGPSLSITLFRCTRNF